MKNKILLIVLFFLASCSREISENDQNLSELIQPSQNYYSSQYQCTLNQKNNLNDLEQYIPTVSYTHLTLPTKNEV